MFATHGFLGPLAYAVGFVNEEEKIDRRVINVTVGDVDLHDKPSVYTMADGTIVKVAGKFDPRKEDIEALVAARLAQEHGQRPTPSHPEDNRRPHSYRQQERHESDLYGYDTYRERPTSYYSYQGDREEMAMDPHQWP